MMSAILRLSPGRCWRQLDGVVKVSGRARLPTMSGGCCLLEEAARRDAGPACNSRPIVQKANRFKNRITEKYLAKIKERDKAGPDYELVYHTKLVNYFNAAQIISCLSISLFVLTGAYIGLPSEGFVQGYFFVRRDELCILYIFLLAHFAIITCLLPKFPQRIYCSRKEKTYKLVTAGYVPWTTRSVQLNSGDVKRSRSKFFNPWNEYRYMTKGGSVIYLEHMAFTNSVHYRKLLRIINPNEDDLDEM